MSLRLHLTSPSVTLLVLMPLWLATLGCCSQKYKSTPQGTMTNADRIWLVWLGPDEFLYVPDADETRRFSFTPRGRETITPAAMYTDGGSIPRFLWSNRELSPWRFAPAFMIHDWLFDTKHCDMKPGLDYTHETAANVMTEAIKTQMELNPEIKNASTLCAIDWAVQNFSRRLWRAKDKCQLPPKNHQIRFAETVLEKVRNREVVVTSSAVMATELQELGEVEFVLMPAATFLQAREPDPAHAVTAAVADVQVLVPVIHVDPRAGEKRPSDRVLPSARRHPLP